MLKSRIRLAIFLAVIVASLVLVPASADSIWSYIRYDAGYDTGTYDSYLFYLSSGSDVIEVLCADYNQFVDPDGDIGITYRKGDPRDLNLSGEDVERVRAILMDNNPTGLDAGKVIAAKQLALWEIINHVKQADPIPDVDIADEVDRLLILPGVPRSGWIYLTEVSQTDNSDGTTTFVYEINTSGKASFEGDYIIKTSVEGKLKDENLTGNILTFTLEADTGYSVHVTGTYPDEITLFIPETSGIQPFIGLNQAVAYADKGNYLYPTEYGRVILRKDVDNVTNDPTEFKVKFTNLDTGVSIVKTIREGSDLAFDLPIGTYKVEEIDIPSRYNFVSIQPETLVVEAPVTMTLFAAESADEIDEDVPVVTVTNRQKSDPTPPIYTNPIQYKLEIIVEGNGSVLPGPGIYTHNAGTVQMISITEDDPFVGWFGDNGAEVYAVGDLYGIAVNSDKKIIARFAAQAEEPIPTEEPIIEEPVAAGSEDEAEEADVELSDEAIPMSAAEELPKTGGLPIAILYMAGGASIISGLALSKGKKKK